MLFLLFVYYRIVNDKDLIANMGNLKKLIVEGQTHMEGLIFEFSGPCSNENYEVSDKSLFFYKNYNSGDFKQGYLYIGQRIVPTNIGFDLEETVVIYVDKVSDKEITFAIVYYELFGKENGNNIYKYKKIETPKFINAKIQINEGICFVSVDTSVLENDDSPYVLVSANSGCELRGWWVNNKNKPLNVAR